MQSSQSWARNLLLSNLEFRGLLAAVGYAELGIGKIFSGFKTKSIPSDAAWKTIHLAKSHQLVSPLGTRL